MATKQPLVIGLENFIAGSQDKPAPSVSGPKGDGLIPPATPKPAPIKKAPVIQRKEPEQAMPWENCNPKITKFVQLRMSEPLDAKLQWIKDNSVGVPSKHALILEAVEKLADERIAELKKQGRAGRS